MPVIPPKTTEMISKSNPACNSDMALSCEICTTVLKSILQQKSIIICLQLKGVEHLKS